MSTVGWLVLVGVLPLVGVVVGYLMGGAAKLAGEEDPRASDPDARLFYDAARTLLLVNALHRDERLMLAEHLEDFEASAVESRDLPPDEVIALCSALGTMRRRLLADAPLTDDTRERLLELIDVMEECLT